MESPRTPRQLPIVFSNNMMASSQKRYGSVTFCQFMGLNCFNFSRGFFACCYFFDVVVFVNVFIECNHLINSWIMYHAFVVSIFILSYLAAKIVVEWTWDENPSDVAWMKFGGKSVSNVCYHILSILCSYIFTDVHWQWILLVQFSLVYPCVRWLNKNWRNWCLEKDVWNEIHKKKCRTK